MALLKLFYFMNFSFCQLKNRALRNLGKVSLAVLTLMAVIKNFGPQHFLSVIICDPSETFLFYNIFFMPI